jgi:hypothetical protein
MLKLINLYGIAVDTQQWELFGDIFSDDVVADYGEGAVFKGLDSFRAFAGLAWSIFDASRHAMSTTTWTIGGGAARTLTYGDWCIVRRGAKGGDVWEGKGWYDDAWVQQDGGWRIRHRCCRVMSSTGNANVMQVDAGIDVRVKTHSLKEAKRTGTLGFLKEPGSDRV